MIWIYIMLYSLVAGLWIFGLLVAAYKWTDPDFPCVYILSGVLWPVAGLPAAGYVAAGWYVNWKEAQKDG